MSLRRLYPEFSRLLKERRDEITGRQSRTRAQIDDQLMSDPGDLADQSVSDTTADYYMNLAETDRIELQRIDNALERIRRGTYGSCPSCGMEIPRERLLKVLTAHLCAECQEAAEVRIRAV